MLVPEPLEEDPFGRVPPFARRRTIFLKNAVDDAREGIQLGTTNRLAAPIARGTENRSILETVSRCSS